VSWSAVTVGLVFLVVAMELTVQSFDREVQRLAGFSI
jgi:hypothetical protein